MSARENISKNRQKSKGLITRTLHKSVLWVADMNAKRFSNTSVSYTRGEKQTKNYLMETSSRNVTRGVPTLKTADAKVAPCNASATKMSPYRPQDKVYTTGFLTFSTLKRNTATRNVRMPVLTTTARGGGGGGGQGSTTLRNSKITRYDSTAPTLRQPRHSYRGIGKHKKYDP